jgi:hypothetical protein
MFCVDPLHRAQAVVPHADTPGTVLPQCDRSRLSSCGNITASPAGSRQRLGLLYAKWSPLSRIATGLEFREGQGETWAAVPVIMAMHTGQQGKGVLW